MTVTRKVAPAGVVLSARELLAMDTHEVERHYQDQEPTPERYHPGQLYRLDVDRADFWRNMLVLTERKMRHHTEYLHKWITALAMALGMVTVVLALLLVGVWTRTV